MRILFLKLRVVGWLFVAILVGVGILYAVEPDFLAVVAPARQLPIYCVQREYNTASLTFDAAWGNEDTQQLIDILARYDVKATFFVVGDWARKFPESVAALHEAGHEVMSHSNHHDHMTQLSPTQIQEDLRLAGESIAAATGVVPTLFRAPYGEYDDKVIKAVKAVGMETIQWDVDTLGTNMNAVRAMSRAAFRCRALCVRLRRV